MLADRFIVFPSMRPQTMLTVFDAGGGVLEIPPAVLPKTVKRTIAEQAAEGFRIRSGVTRKILALPVLKKVVMRHNFSS